MLIALDRKAFEHALTRWAEALLSRPSPPQRHCRRPTPWTASRPGGASTASRAVHLLSLLAHESGLTLCRRPSPTAVRTANEHKAALRLLEGLVLQGRLVTGDAIFCARSAGRSAEGDYLVFVRQPPTLLMTSDAFAPPRGFSPSQHIYHAIHAHPHNTHRVALAHALRLSCLASHQHSRNLAQSATSHLSPPHVSPHSHRSHYYYSPPHPPSPVLLHHILPTTTSPPPPSPPPPAGLIVGGWTLVCSSLLAWDL